MPRPSSIDWHALLRGRDPGDLPTTEYKRVEKTEGCQGNTSRLQDGKLVCWAGNIDFGMSGGKRRRKEFSAPTRTELRKKMKAFLADLKREKRQSDDGETFADYLDRWLAVRKLDLDPMSYVRWEMVVRVHLKTSALATMKLPEIRRAHIQAYVAQKVSERKAAATIHQHKSVLNVAFNAALDEDPPLIEANPCARVTLPKYTSKARSLPESELAEFFAAIRGHHWELFWQMMFVLGLRKSELRLLRWESVDFTADRIRIPKVKTPNSQRLLPLPPALKRRLLAHREAQRERWGECDLVFINARGNLSRPAEFNRALDRILLREKLPHFRVHDLRHTCITRLAENQVHPSVAQNIAGHSAIQTTLGIYTHMNDSDAAVEAILLLDNMLRDAA